MQQRIKIGIVSIGVGVLLLQAKIISAQLTDETQTAPHVPGSVIAKSLEEQIGVGHGDAFTPGSSTYLIKRDPARAIRRGRQLFQRKFTADQGQGPRVNADSTGDIQDTPALGAGLADACATCHGRPRGSAGFGGDVATRPDSRDAPHLFGLGLQEMLADEITQDLRAIRAAAMEEAVDTGSPVMLPLESKGIHYGWITGLPDGTVDTSLLEGVNPDCRVRPFFAEGRTSSIREFIAGAFKAEMGLESPDALLCAVTDPQHPQAIMTPAGMVLDPTQDAIEQPPVCDVNEDGDNDGIVNEIDTAVVDFMEFYLLNYFKPGRAKIPRRARKGLQLMERIGCTSCHVQHLTLNRDRRIADVETIYDPKHGIFNRLFATVSPLFETVSDGDPFPQLLPQERSFLVENIFTDFKRHDLGPNFHERQYDGSIVTEFLTEPLWGVGSTPPYGHDGRSINLEEVIRRHGGEAQAARDAFVALGNNKQRKIIEFLSTLVLFPPDDTASNLNPGNPGTSNPQDLVEHGSINLGVLFQIPTEGPE